MQKLRWLAILMGITILGITGFQGYWLKNNYDREKQTLELKTNADFRLTILQLQASKLKLEKITVQSSSLLPKPPGIAVRRSGKDDRTIVKDRSSKEPAITMINLLQEKMREYETDSNRKKTIIISAKGNKDSLPGKHLQGNIRSMTITATHDSLPGIDPELIREIRVNNNSKNGKRADTAVTIGIRPNLSGRIKTDTIIESAHVFTNRTDQGIITEDLVERSDKHGFPGRNRDAVFQFLYDVDSLSLKDSVTIKEITDAYTAKLKEEKMSLSFAVSKLDSTHTDSPAFNEVTIGFANPVTYSLSLDNKVSYILKQLKLPILFSLLLVGITIFSFVMLYRSLLKQRRLAELKNQFISNITHELKTPIATVGVAIEALKNFNAIHDPQRTKEYLDISQNELQRLSMLVDKVLKLSMFEKKEIELKKEQFDCKQLVEEVMNSMKLQFEKHHAKVKLHTEGDNFIIDADKLHITSVIYNLLDNALKYSKEDPAIDVQLSSYPEYIEFSVKDNGIGIEPAYQEKIFDKFFRVPTGDQHNTKGYGLGLSYVAEVIRRHHGQISAESEFGKGSTFTAKVPHTQAS
jgi:two-component system phosphate regulon sensor histidine kinase PhoR